MQSRMLSKHTDFRLQLQLSLSVMHSSSLDSVSYSITVSAPDSSSGGGVGGRLRLRSRCDFRAIGPVLTITPPGVIDSVPRLMLRSKPTVGAPLIRVIRKTRTSARRQFQAARALPTPELPPPSPLATDPSHRHRVYSVETFEYVFKL